MGAILHRYAIGAQWHMHATVVLPYGPGVIVMLLHDLRR